jgi:hypothetical protein
MACRSVAPGRSREEQGRSGGVHGRPVSARGLRGALLLAGAGNGAGSVFSWSRPRLNFLFFCAMKDAACRTRDA